jgi:hypothetical protein
VSYFTDDQAIEIWKARWCGTTIQALIRKYGENPFRIYEVLSEERNGGTRLVAFEQLKIENPIVAARTDPKPHVQKRMVVPLPITDTDQLHLF